MLRHPPLPVERLADEPRYPADPVRLLGQGFALVPGLERPGVDEFLEASRVSFWSQHTAPPSLTSKPNGGNAWTALARRLISQLILSCTSLARTHVACSRGKSR